MKRCSLCGVEKPTNSFSKHATGLGGLRSGCKACSRLEFNRWYQLTKVERAAAYREKTQAWRALPGNAERNRQAAKVWYQDNPSNAQRARDRTRAWVEANKDQKRASDKGWRKRNGPRVVAYITAYLATKRAATPQWANDFFMQEAYDLAALRTQITGFSWEVDHIVPLQSNYVCGMHVENNLQVIPASANRKKSNRQWPDMP